MSDNNDVQKEEMNEDVTTEEQKDESQDDGLTEVERLQKKCDEYLAGWKRAKADYSNFKKEVDNRQKDLLQYANAALLAELIPVYDNFKKAFAFSPKEESKEWQNWQMGIGHIQKQMWDFIEKFGIKEIETVGKEFDPKLHESIGKEKSDEHESGTIVKEVVPGYMLHDKVLNPAKVILAE